VQRKYTSTISWRQTDAPEPKHPVGRLDCGHAGTVSIELLLVAVVGLIGLIVVFTSIRDSVVSEMSDLSGAIQGLNQSTAVNGATGASSTTAGFDFQDGSDVDGAIAYDTAPTNEFGVLFSTSDTGAFDNIVLENRTTATATLGDGTIDTNVTVSTDTGALSGMVGNEIRFRESPGTEGTFTIDFDDPVVNLELWFRNIADNNTGSPSLVGNFTVTLSDGQVIDDAPFTIINDAIVRNSMFGEFNTLSTDQELLAKVNHLGNMFVTDPTPSDDFNSQGAGRITFDDAPLFGGVADSNTVGITSISFDRIGGAGGFQAALSVSGQAVVP